MRERRRWDGASVCVEELLDLCAYHLECRSIFMINTPRKPCVCCCLMNIAQLRTAFERGLRWNNQRGAQNSSVTLAWKTEDA